MIHHLYIDFLTPIEPCFKNYLGLIFSWVTHKYMFNNKSREYYEEFICKTLAPISITVKSVVYFCPDSFFLYYMHIILRVNHQ